jgi:hypothetical protein
MLSERPHTPMPAQSDDFNTTGTKEVRVRFSRFEFHRAQTGQCTAEVVLEMDGVMHRGQSAGPSSPLGDLRISAEACLRALAGFSAPNEFELMAVKHVRAFDSNLAIVSVSHRQNGEMYPLVGCYLAKDDVCRGAAIAVLNATNRVMSVAADQAHE